MRCLFLTLCLCLGMISCAYSCGVIDDAGNTIQLKQAAQRIISLAPDITETLFAIGAGPQIVGVLAGSDYPPAAQKLPQVGTYNGIDLEKIIALHPDLIIGWKPMFARQLAQLKTFHIPIYISDPHRLEDLPLIFQRLGCLTGKAMRAGQVAKNFSEKLNILQKKYTQQTPVTVFFQIGEYALFTINRDSWINQVIDLCGGRNVFANAQFLAPKVSWEALVVANPQVILCDAPDTHWRDSWRAFPMIRAVKMQQFYDIKPDGIERASPRLIQGVQEICMALQKTRNLGHF